jgi:hypothetical protein
VGGKFLAVELHWNARLERDPDCLDTIWCLLWRDRHSKVHELITVCIEFFEKTCLIAGMEAILV